MIEKPENQERVKKKNADPRRNRRYLAKLSEFAAVVETV